MSVPTPSDGPRILRSLPSPVLGERDPITTATRTAADLSVRTAAPASGPVSFTIRLTRLAPAGATPGPPGLISVAVESADRKRAARLGSLTDVALRSRLAHFDAHPANEIAALRRALASEGGEFVLTERWPAREACLRSWYGFTGAKMKLIEWTCEKCSAACRENAGGGPGELFLLVCSCGQTATFPIPLTR
jgi:hypothetical protein